MNYTAKEIQDILTGIGRWSLAITVFGFTGYLIYIGKLKPELLTEGTALIMGYYFGSKR